MFILLPYTVDVPRNHRPVMNWLLIISVIVAFFIQIGASNETVRSYVLDGWNMKGMVGHMWLHGGILHLFGNMLFLWLFGNAVCSKVGNLLYIPIYLGLGLIAAASHLIFDGGAAIGASGAINGIVGMYLVFFFENEISCLFWFIFLCFIFKPVFFTVASYWMILLWFGFDILEASIGKGNVAYIAHIGGFLGGIGLAVLMLKTKLVTMERYEKSLLDLLKPKTRKTFKTETIGSTFGAKKPEIYKKVRVKPEVQSMEKNKPVESVIRFECRCGQKIKVPGIYGGKTGRCPKCSARIVIPQL
jgi:membrane associated rhomboid family serine protease